VYETVSQRQLRSREATWEVVPQADPPSAEKSEARPASRPARSAVHKAATGSVLVRQQGQSSYLSIDVEGMQ